MRRLNIENLQKPEDTPTSYKLNDKTLEIVEKEKDIGVLECCTIRGYT